MLKKLIIFVFSGYFVLYADIDFYQESNNTVIKLQPVDISQYHLKRAPKQAVNWYKNDNGILLGLKKSFFLSAHDSRLLQEITKDFNLTLHRQYPNNLYLVETKNKEVLRTINRINKKYNRLIAHPNFYKKVTKR